MVADAGKWLRARAAYTDGHGPSKTANEVTAAAVAAVAAPAVSTVAVTSAAKAPTTPTRSADTIVVTVTFSETVVVTVHAHAEDPGGNG